MDTLPGLVRFRGRDMTGGAVAAGDKVLPGCSADQHTVCPMTAGTGIVILQVARLNQGRRIEVTKSTGATGHRHQVGVIRGAGDMDRFPVFRMTGGTVAITKSNTERTAEPCSISAVVAVGAAAVGVCGKADQSIIVTVRGPTGRQTNPNRWVVIRGIVDVNDLPVGIRFRMGDMTGNTITSTSRDISTSTMTVVTGASMCLLDRPVSSSPNCVTIYTEGRTVSHIAEGHMINNSVT